MGFLGEVGHNDVHFYRPATPETSITRPVTAFERSFVMTPMAGGLRLAGTVELAGLDAPENPERADILYQHAETLLPGLNREDATRWMGCRPSLPDSLPVIGPSPNSDAVYFAFGHQHLGLTQAAITAEIIGTLVHGRDSEIDLAPFRVDRF
jgi:D-amino-acid dehydrogenase